MKILYDLFVQKNYSEVITRCQDKLVQQPENYEIYYCGVIAQILSGNVIAGCGHLEKIIHSRLSTNKKTILKIWHSWKIAAINYL